MALTDGENGNGMIMPVQPMGYGYGGGGYGGGYGFGVPYAVPVMGGFGNYGGGYGGFGGDWGSLIVLFLFAAMFGGFGGGWGGGFGGWGGFGDSGFPWLLASNANNQNATNAGFDQAATQSTLAGIQNSITTGFSNVEVSACNRAMDAMQTAYNNEIADLNRSFAAQTAIDNRLDTLSSDLQKCCCDNQLQTESLRATVLQENCEDRNQALLNTRDILTAGVTNTQAVLDAVRGINDKLCDQELQAERRENQELRSQIQMQNLAASQAAQTAALVADNTQQTATLINRIAPYPVPAYPAFGYGNCYGNGYGNNGWGWGNFGFGGFNPFGNVGFGNGSF